MAIDSRALDVRLLVFGLVLLVVALGLMVVGGVQVASGNWWGVVGLILGCGFLDAARRQLTGCRPTLELDSSGVLGLGNPSGALAWREIRTAEVSGGRLVVVPKEEEQYTRSPHPYLIHLGAPKTALVAQLDAAVVDDVKALLRRVK